MSRSTMDQEGEALPPESVPYDVGYGKPPRDTQFKPGQSGNPKGRRKGSRNFRTMTREALNQKMRITESGRSRVVTKGEAIIMAMTAKAIRGDVRAGGIMMKHMEEERHMPMKMTWNAVIEMLDDGELELALDDIEQALTVQPKA